MKYYKEEVYIGKQQQHASSSKKGAIRTRMLQEKLLATYERDAQFYSYSFHS